ncbi:MAG: response regulator transcription factor [Bacteriovoracaceae bacterium]|nr:response regulator transcription factor [Bacteriovoracaceae bacterium]
MDTKKVLVIDDEPHIAEGVKLNLELQGYDVQIAPNGIKGIELWKNWSPDLIVLDLMMPGVDGYSVLDRIRTEDERLPILVLSAKDAARDKIKCLAGGVDDYLSKPFNLDEFLLRVERLLTRSGWSNEDKKEDAQENFSFGPNQINFVTNKATRNGEEFQLTAQEIKIIKIFIKNIGKPLSRGDLLQEGWGYHESANSRTVDNFIVRLRKYFEEDPKNPVFFTSLRSVGYVFNVE